MSENWFPVLVENGKCAINGNNIVLQNRENNEIGYAEDTLENRQLFGVHEAETVESCETVNVSSETAAGSNFASAEEVTGLIDINKIEWGEETKLLLDLYCEYLPRVSPMKQFKTKKKMWDKIAQDIYSKLKIIRTSVQCESRFKTIKRRKNSLQSENKISGSSPSTVPYEDEFNKIRSIDDSLDPEVLIDTTHKIVNSKESDATDSSDQDRTKMKDASKKCRVSDAPKRKCDRIVCTLLTIHKDKEANRERRHKEKMELLEMLVKKRKTPNCD